MRGQIFILDIGIGIRPQPLTFPINVIFPPNSKDVKMGLGKSNKVLNKRGRFYFFHMEDTHTGGMGVGLNI